MNIAARYARALFALDGDAAARQEQLAVISEACTAPQALAFWQHPGVKLRERQELAAAVAARVDSSNKQLHNFLLLLVEQQRMHLLPAIATLPLRTGEKTGRNRRCRRDFFAPAAGRTAGGN